MALAKSARGGELARRKAFWQRVRQRLDTLGRTPAWLAQGVGASSAWATEAFTLYRNPQLQFLVKMPKLLQCSLEWLMTGDGPISPPGRSKSEEYAAGRRDALAEAVRMLLDL